MKQLAAAALLAGVSPAFGAQLADYGEPAIIEVVASQAVVVEAGGHKTIMLIDVDRLATVVAALHKQDNRVFEAFPTAKLPAAWNSCNEMKEQNKLFHQDGANSLVAFDNGPEAANATPYLAAPPLVTAPRDRKRITSDSEGMARLMLVNAAFVSGDLHFTIKGGSIKLGKYDRVRVLTECILE
ncbi:hypothetical protein [Aestuariivirga sp.]|jgi:hypothetical protein|uniref:hypothetical protein n=1 Tax=Aestuariivirga sp. TaxID=2650926 RepID=UPI003783336E